MLSLLQLKHNVRLDHVKHLFSLSFELDLVSSRHAGHDFDDKLSALLHDSLALAVLAVLFVNPSLALAVAARLLHLHLHESHLDVLHSHALPVALRTHLLLAAFCAGAFALLAVHIPVDGVNWTLATV